MWGGGGARDREIKGEVGLESLKLNKEIFSLVSSTNDL